MVLQNSRWLVKDGNVSFWRDKWLESGPICAQQSIVNHPNLLVKHCMVNNSWDVDMLVQLVGQELTNNIVLKISGIREGSDILVWMGNLDGGFTSKSAWNIV